MLRKLYKYLSPSPASETSEAIYKIIKHDLSMQYIACLHRGLSCGMAFDQFILPSNFILCKKRLNRK